MNRKITPFLFAAALFGAPAIFAQGAAPGGGEGGRAGLVEKSDQELEQEFQRLAREISKGMGKLEGDIAKASLPPRRVEELKAELDAMLKQAGEGSAARSHEGLRSWLEAHPARAAEVLGVSAEKLTELLKSDADYLKAISERHAEVAKALEDSATLQAVLQRQAEIELRVSELIEKQKEQANQLGKTLEDILDVAYEIRDRAPP
jgi:DNA repair exonuclease SbcCD ATPase subunit